MELEDIQKVVEQFLDEDKTRSCVVMFSDKDRFMHLFNRKGDDVSKLFYSSFMADKSDRLLDCIEEAAQAYLEQKQQKRGAEVLQMFALCQNKYKS